MAKQSPIEVRPRIPGSVAFTIECPNSAECIVRWQYANTGMYGVIGDIGFISDSGWTFLESHPDVPTLFRSETPVLSFHPFGELPECILHSGRKAMLIGPYLSYHEIGVIADATERWIDGAAPTEIAGDLHDRLGNLDIAPLTLKSWNTELWNSLLENPPKRCAVEQDDDCSNVSVTFKYFTIRFREDKLTCEQKHLGYFVTQTDIRYEAICNIRELWNGSFRIDFLSEDKQSMRRYRAVGNSWIASLVASRVGQAVRPSKTQSTSFMETIGQRKHTVTEQVNCQP